MWKLLSLTLAKVGLAVGTKANKRHNPSSSAKEGVNIAAEVIDAVVDEALIKATSATRPSPGQPLPSISVPPPGAV